MSALPRPPLGRALIAGLVAALAALGLVRALEPGVEAVPAPPIRQSSAGAADAGAALAAIDTMLAGLRALTADRPDDWLHQERIAQQLMARARLAGSFADYALAQRALAQGFAAATPGAGPHLTQAALALALHRLDPAERMLDAVARYAVEPEAESRAAAAALRGDIALYRGRYATALSHYRSLTRSGEAPDYRLAIFWARMGRPDAALAAVARAERAGPMPRQALASLALQRGTIALQQGDWEAAAAAFDDAANRFPGWWLSRAHQAQLLALRGRHAEAITAFAALTRASDDPLIRDALASLYRADGDPVAARRWADEAGRGWTERLRLLPEAAFGHAAEHELAFGDPARALALARRDFALRPHGATAVTLGWALLANNQPAAALRVAERVDQSSWRSADQYLLAARAAAMLGDDAAAQAAEAQALAINPRAADAAASLWWFGH